jgi:hypothetical protein
MEKGNRVYMVKVKRQMKWKEEDLGQKKKKNQVGEKTRRELFV